MTGSKKNAPQVLRVPEDLILLFGGNGIERRSRKNDSQSGQKLSTSLFTRLASDQREDLW